MNRNLIYLVMILLTTHSFAQKSRDLEKKQLLQIEQKWNDAIASKDTNYIKSLLHRNFVLISADAKSYFLKDIIANLSDTSIVIQPYSSENVEVRIFGNTAILTGSFTQNLIYKNKPYTQKMSYTDVYIKTKKDWKAVSAHATSIK